MCSILFTNKTLGDIARLNRYLKNRGPDSTSHLEIEGYHFVHNLLSLTGDFTPQPLMDGKNRVLLLFNGEIYNYKTFGNFPSDGYSILAAYQKHGIDFAKHLDGEFAVVLVDLKNKLVLMATDTFGTKPLWWSIEGKNIGVASYKSGLDRLGFWKSKQLEANKVLAFRLGTYEKVGESVAMEFNLNQYKETYDDWIRAFQEAVRKRAFHSTEQRIFLGLSAGYDSGALACELTAQKVDFKAYTVMATEDISIIEQRHALLANGRKIQLTKTDYARLKKKIESECESYKLLESNGKTYQIVKDQGAMGVACICEAGLLDLRKINFSGHGSDEIYADSGHSGRPFSRDRDSRGTFPADLKPIFPWECFYRGAQQKLLAKEEYVSGTYGVEGRYPYLDKYLVQEFLNLSAELKNAHYKAPLHEYLTRNNYPFQVNLKTGFYAGSNLK